MVSSTWARSPRKADNAVGVAAFSTCWYPVSSAAGWSSLVARRAHNPKVAGSNPAPATTTAGQARTSCRGAGA